MIVFLQDFKLYYDVRFGRKEEPKQEDSDGRSNTNGSYANGAISANGSAKKNASDLAIFEQFERQVDFVLCSNFAKL